MGAKREYVRRIVVFEDHFKEFKTKLDKNTLKKTRRTPASEIEKANELMKRYFEQKKEETHER